MENPRIKRTQVIVQKDFQFRFARFVILFALTTTLVSCLTVFITTFSLLGDKLAAVYPQGRLAQIFRTVYLALGANIVLIVPVIFYVSIHFSHRIVGPLPKIYDALKRIGEGDFNQYIVLRKNDELRPLANVINEMVVNLKKSKELNKSPQDGKS